MKKIECRGCGAKKSVPTSFGGSVGAICDRTGFTWLPSAEGDSIWVCRKCAERLLGLLQEIQDLVGDLYTYPPTALGMLKQRLEKTKKVEKG